MKKKKSMLVTLIVSNVLILAIAVCVAVVNFFGYRKFSSKQADGYHDIIARQIKTTFDQRMYGLKSILMDLSTDELVLSLIKSEKEDLHSNMYPVLEIKNRLSSYDFMYDFLDSAMIYYPKAGSIISSQSFYSNLDLFRAASSHDYWDKEQWEALTKPQYQISYCFQKDIFTIVCPISDGKDWAYVFVNSNVQFLNQLVEEAKVLENCSISMWNLDSGELIFELGKSGMAQEYVKNLEPSDIAIESFRDGKNLITRVDSDIMDCAYYFMIPENTFIENAIDVFTLSMTGVIVMLGAFGVVLLAYYNFKPIKEVYYKIQGSEFSAAEFGESGNELEMIGKVTERTIRNYRDLKEILDKYEPTLQAQLAERIMGGQLAVTQEMLERYRRIGFTLDYPKSYVILISAERGDDENVEAMIVDRIDDWAEAAFRIDGESVSYVSNSREERWAILVNTNVYDRLEIEDRLKAMTKMMQQEYQWTMTCVYTKPTENWSEISDLFVLGVKALEYQLIRCPGVIVYAAASQEYKDIYYYPMETENRLINCVKTGNSKAVNEIINEIIIQNFVAQQISMESARCLGFNLVGTAFKVMSIQKMERDDLVYKQDQIYQEFLHCKNIYEIEVKMRQLFSKICRNIQIQKGKQPSELINKVCQYMGEHSADASLSLASTAEEFGINPNYLSGSFKEQTGTNFLAYLNELRLEHAKRILRETEAPLAEIAELVGYSNSAVLIRNFKKREGITPGQYRAELEI